MLSTAESHLRTNNGKTDRQTDRDKEGSRGGDTKREHSLSKAK